MSGSGRAVSGSPDGSPADRVSADGVPADGVPADGVSADRVSADGVPADGLSADGVFADRVSADGLSEGFGGGRMFCGAFMPQLTAMHARPLDHVGEGEALVLSSGARLPGARKNCPAPRLSDSTPLQTSEPNGLPARPIAPLYSAPPD